MKTYLRVVNPILAVLVLVLCLVASAFDEGDFKPDEMLSGGVPTYFLAKGIFCSSALFILGQLLLHLVGGSKGPHGSGTQ